MENQLDPQALALAKAIRRTETGGHKDPYNARGASGEFGAFQFMPATYKSLAQKHLGNANAAPTIENQNKIVYSEIKALKDQGYNPAQIASIWNSGNPDRYKNGGVGVNKYGVSYNVPQYVSKVSQNYKALIGTVQPVQQKPVEPVEPTIEQQKQERIAQGLPVSVREDRAEPTMVGGIIREIVKQPLKAALSVARPVAGYSKGVSVDTNYLGNVADYGTEIQKDTTNLANKYKAGEISLGRAAIGGAGAGAKQAMDFAAVAPVGQVAAGAKAGIVSKTAIPTLKTAAKESLIRGGAVGAGYDASSQLASGEKYNPAQTLAAGAIGTALDFGLTKVLPEGVEAGRRRFSNAPEYVNERTNKIVEQKMKDIFDIENSYAKTRKAMDYAKDANATARRRVAETDVLVGSVDDTGTIRTKQPGGAVDKYSAMTIEGKEGVVRDLLEREGLSITPQELQKKLISVIDNDRMLQGKARTKALNDVVDEVAAYTRNADGNIPLSSVHDAKIATTKVIKDFATPVEYKTYQKALARGLKEAIENNSTEDIRIINNELAEYYKDIRLLESLDGKKVKGGKLGKYFSQISGNIIGGIAGNAVGGPVGSAVGTIVGGEVGGHIRSNTFTKTFGKAKGGTARQSDILTKATVKSKSPKLPLGLPEGRGPAENLSPIRLPAPKKTVIEPRAKIVGYSNNDGNLNQRYNSTATASKTGISKVSRETPKKSSRIISEEAYQKALKNLGDTSTLNSTPIHLSKDALIVAGYHIENGVRSAAELGIELAKKGYKFTKEQLEELFNKAKETKQSPLPKAKVEITNPSLLKPKSNITARDISGTKFEIPSGKAIKVGQGKGSNMIIEIGDKQFTINKGQFDNIKGQSISDTAKKFAPELDNFEETVKGSSKMSIRNKAYSDFESGKITREERNRIIDKLGVPNETKYSQYTLPGGEDYAEILIKVPGGKFKSSHWEEEGVLAHIRRKFYNYIGKKLYFLEELQSDWAREARASKTTASHPDLKNWQELSIKRALKDAVDNNSDYFAWINGEQTSARYNLATQVDNVKWEQTANGKKINVNAKQGKDIVVRVEDDGTVKRSETVPNEWIGKKLDEVLGKGLADKIMEKESGTLAGDGLKFGGEWASNLYDKQVKSIVEDLTGQKVEMLDLGLPVNGEKQLFTNMTGTTLRPNQLKVGMQIQQGDTSANYIITDILGDGKFKAVKKDHFSKTKHPAFDSKMDNRGYYDTSDKQTFDISTKQSQQMGIKLTPEVKAIIRGESPLAKERKKFKLPPATSAGIPLIFLMFMNKEEKKKGLPTKK